MDNDEIAAALRSALVDGDFSAFEALLHPAALWGECASPSAIIAMVKQMQRSGLTASSLALTAVPEEPGRIGVTLHAEQNGAAFKIHHTVFFEDEMIIEIVPVDDANSFAAARRLGPFDNSDEPVGFNSVAPVLPVRSVNASLEHYSKLGFEATSYGGDADYGYLQRGDVHLHVSQVSHLDPKTTTSAVYLYVDDAKALYAQWRDAGVEGRLVPPSDTEYGLCEGAHIDADGNLLRFGSPV